MCDPDRGCVAYAYDLVGNPIRVTFAGGGAVDTTYDALGRPLSRSGGYTWRYDESDHGAGLGRLTTATFPIGSDQFSYDFAGRATTETRCRDGICTVLRRSFESTGSGRLASVVYPDAPGTPPAATETVSYDYNQRGELASLSGYATALGFDARGRWTSASLANGVQESYTYDPARRRLTRALVARGSSVLFQADYGYQADGEITQLTVDYDNAGPATTQFGHDDLHRLTSVSGVQSQTLAYDPLGRITSNSLRGSYAYGDPLHRHAVTTAGQSGLAYHDDGNLVSAAGKSFTWDDDHRLSAVTGGGQTTSFAYDGAGQRVKKAAPSGAVTYYFGPLLELEGGSLTKYIVAGGRRIAQNRGASSRHFFHQDHLASVRIITDGGGAVKRRYDYRPFGQLLSTSGSLSSSVRFTDHRTDDETGLIYMNARYYDPTLGRFLSPDPVLSDPANPQDLDRFAYVRNGPLHNT